MATRCAHFEEIQGKEPRTPDGCEECLAMDADWIHLRLCLVCGHVGCCDDSPNRHATKHFHESNHAMMRSFEPGENWGWCFIDEEFFQPMPAFGIKRLNYL